MQRSFLKSLVFAIVTALSLTLSPGALAQAVVSSGITGTIADGTGKVIAGATVTIVHVPTNTSYTAITGKNGRFQVSGLRIGGPYTVSANAGTYTVEPVNEVYLSLSEAADVTLLAKDETVTLEKFVTTSSRNELDANATGAGSVLNSRQILEQPTSNRSFADLIKTNPFVSMRAFPQVQALGMNNRYNSITIDGARLNDQFGLSSSGLLSLNNPFSLDALDQFSVSLTPYDVSQSGFAGASINAVSKSGTNTFSGSLYYLYSSDHWQGKDLSGSTIGKRPTQFWERTFGGTLGGPIIPNRLFFFLNYEKYNKPSGAASRPGFNPDPAFLTFLDAQIKALPGSPNLGTFGGAGGNLDTDTKRLAKIDWKITNDHRLAVRYSDTKGSRPSFGAFSSTAFSNNITLPGAGNTGYSGGITSYSSEFFATTVIEKVWAAQLFDSWTPDFKTQFNFSKNDSSSLRTVPINFPEIRIFRVPGTSSAATPVTIDPLITPDAFVVGAEVSSQGNGVITNSKSYSGGGEYTWRDYLFKFGFDREETDFNNLFRAGSFGVFAYNYSPTLNLATDTPLAFGRSVAQTGFPGTDISRYEQTGYFAQAKWEPTRRFSLTLGARYDLLGSPIAPPTNAGFATAFGTIYPGIRNDATIDGQSQFAPRVSFNYSLDDKRVTQLRGGVGVFLGRNPWVWISNSYGNAGFGRYTQLSSAVSPGPNLTTYLTTQFDPAAPMGVGPAIPLAATQTINLIQPGLKLPTNLRGNFAIDRKLPGLGATVTLEVIYNKQTEALFTDNMNLKVLNGDANNIPTATSLGADGRIRFATNAAGNGGSANAPLVAGYANVLRLRNVKAGASTYVALSIDRAMKDGWAYNAAYTHGHATEGQPSGSSTAGSQWGFNGVFNQNAVEVVRSDYEVKNRIQVTLTKEFNFFQRARTTVSLYYEGRTGQPFSYVYSGDLNKDGQSGQDLVAVPVDASDARFDFSTMSATVQTAYFDYLTRSGLNHYAGHYAPRNSFTTPWQNRLDLYFDQEVRTVGPVKVSLFASFVNFGAWLDKSMFNYIEELNTSTANSNQNIVLGNASYSAAGRIIPTATLDAFGNLVFPAASTIVANNGDARWRIEGGVRIKF